MIEVLSKRAGVVSCPGFRNWVLKIENFIKLLGILFFKGVPETTIYTEIITKRVFTH